MREPRTVSGHRSPFPPSGAAGGFDATSDAPGGRPRSTITQALWGVGEGLLPLIILVATIALCWEVSVIGRRLATPHGIAALQWTEMATVGGGLLLSLIVYLVAALRSFQGIRQRQRDGDHVEATVALTFLALSGLVTLWPLFLAASFAQHPAP